MKKYVTIVDYGSGNLLSVSRAFEHFGAEVIQTNDPKTINNSDYLVLPGVGAFQAAMCQLRSRKLVEPIIKHTQSERPFLGICLGMQVMLDDSNEFGIFKGLGLIAGSVREIPDTNDEGIPHPVPHIGWNRLTKISTGWHGTILDGFVQDRDSVYFVHSYAAYPKLEKHVLASCSYNGRKLVAAISSGNLYGCQFHPEKSGEVGLKILQNYLSL